jgi:hypothetical protein
MALALAICRAKGKMRQVITRRMTMSMLSKRWSLRTLMRAMSLELLKMSLRASRKRVILSRMITMNWSTIKIQTLDQGHLWTPLSLDLLSILLRAIRLTQIKNTAQMGKKWKSMLMMST